MSIVIIPDVHGRTFWKDAVKGHEEDTIVFLGDYLDPYMYEFEKPYNMDPYETRLDYENIRRNTIDNFKEIIEFKKQHSNVILLLGNHDCSYAISTEICDCRRDRTNYNEISKLFTDNAELFQIAYEVVINDKKFIFSHAGFQKDYIDCITDNSEKIVEEMNTFWLENNWGVMQSLGLCSYYRGGFSSYGSCVWADLREFSGLSDIAYQIFGHTQLSEPLVTNKFACLDCRRGFILNDEGKITRLDGVDIPVKMLETSEEDTDS